MNANSANALLKMLEEPPLNMHIMLVTPIGAETVRSRCQRFVMDKILVLQRAGWQIRSGL